jgi:hypothetical protein
VNFQPALADLVMAGRKTATRRLVSDNPRSPWYRERCGFRVGQDFAVCPGRSKTQIGRAVVTVVARELLGYLDYADARREGFADAFAFIDAWKAINGSYDPNALVWRVEFERV